MLFAPEEEGQGTVEYLLILILAIVVIIVVVKLVWPAFSIALQNLLKPE